MSVRDGAVHSAIKRWAEKGMVSSEQAQTLHDETIENAGDAGRRWSQFIVAGTGAVVLVIAAGTFLEWAWPLMGPGWQSSVLALAGVGAYLVGIRLEGAGRWGPVGYFLQMAGPVTLLMALGYSAHAWADGSPGGIGVGVLSLAVPPITLVHAVRRNTVMPAVHAMLGFLQKKCSLILRIMETRPRLRSPSQCVKHWTKDELRLAIWSRLSPSAQD